MGDSIGGCENAEAKQSGLRKELNKLRAKGSLVLVVGDTSEKVTELVAERLLTPLDGQQAHQLIIDPAEQYEETSEEVRASLPSGDSGAFEYVDELLVRGSQTKVTVDGPTGDFSYPERSVAPYAQKIHDWIRDVQMKYPDSASGEMKVWVNATRPFLLHRDAPMVFRFFQIVAQVVHDTETLFAARYRGTCTDEELKEIIPAFDAILILRQKGRQVKQQLYFPSSGVRTEWAKLADLPSE